MKSVVSISLGSNIRDHRGKITLGNTVVEASRIGVNGDAKLMRERYLELDGKVDAFGAGGFIFGFQIDDRYYKLKSVNKLTKGVSKTPIVDGSGIKNTIERNVLQMMSDEISEAI